MKLILLVAIFLASPLPGFLSCFGGCSAVVKQVPTKSQVDNVIRMQREQIKKGELALAKTNKENAASIDKLNNFFSASTASSRLFSVSDAQLMKELEGLK